MELITCSLMWNVDSVNVLDDRSHVWLHVVICSHVDLSLLCFFKFPNYFQKFFLNPPIILKIILTNIYIVLLTKNPFKLANKPHKITSSNNYFNYVKKAVNSCSHGYEKYLIVGVSLYKCKCVMSWETKQQPFKCISNFKVNFYYF